MKPIYIFINAMVWPLISWGQFCDKGSVLAKTWRAQKEWYREDSVPSKDNPQLRFETLVDTKGARYVLPYNIKTHFNSKITVASSLDKSGETTEFTKYCADDKMSMILTKNRLDTSNNSQFRIPIRNYLPLQLAGDKSTSLHITSKNGLTAKVHLSKESIVKNNDAILNAYGEDSIESVLSKKITDRLQNQLTSANSGTVVLNLDGMDDLACDLLRGRADIDFYHFGEMDNAEVKMIQSVNPQEVIDIYSDLAAEIPPLNSKEESYFVAGRITMRHMLNSSPSSIDMDKKSFEITAQFFDTKGYFLKGLIPNDELVCLAENHSQFEKKRNNAWIQLNLNLQPLTNLITNNK